MNIKQYPQERRRSVKCNWNELTNIVQTSVTSEFWSLHSMYKLWLTQKKKKPILESTGPILITLSTGPTSSDDMTRQGNFGVQE